jgi:hypothetical protein
MAIVLGPTGLPPLVGAATTTRRRTKDDVYPGAMALVRATVRRVLAPLPLSTDDERTEALSAVRDAVQHARQGTTATLPAAYRSFDRYIERACEKRDLLNPWPDAIMQRNDSHRNDALVLLAAELRFEPFAIGVLATCRHRPSNVWTDLRSALHTIWFWAIEYDVELARAVSLVAGGYGTRAAFLPFTALIDAVLEPHVLDDADREQHASELSALATDRLIEARPTRPARAHFIRPLREEAERLGLVAVAQREVSELVVSLLEELARQPDDAERARLREQLAPLLDVLGQGGDR